MFNSATAGAPSTWFSLFHLRRAADVAGVSPVAVPVLMLVLLLHFPEKHLAESSAWLVVKVHHIHMYGFIL